MNKVLILLLTIVGGCMFGTQSSINSALGKRIGAIESSLFSILISALVLIIVVSLFGKGNLSLIREVPKWQLLGGFMGAFIVTVMVIAVPKIGGASAIIGVIFGQLLISLIIDHFGLFNVPVMKFDIYRLAGIIFILIGLALVFKKNFEGYL